MREGKKEKERALRTEEREMWERFEISPSTPASSDGKPEEVARSV